MHVDISVAVRADRYVTDFTANSLFQISYVVQRLFWQILFFAAAADVACLLYTS